MSAMPQTEHGTHYPVGVVVGRSGALADVQARLATRGLTISALRELAGLVRALEVALAHTPKLSETLHAVRLAELERVLQALQERARIDSHALCAGLDAEITAVFAELDALASNSRSLLWPPKLARVLRLRAKLARLRRERDAGLARANPAMQSALRAVETHRVSRVEFVRLAVVAAQTKLDAARSALESPEYRGAVAESEVADELAKLPDSYTVIHNLSLSFQKAIRFNGNWLQSAQLDHAVVGPSGVFVIETKAWSREFVEKDDFFDPFHQVDRAAYGAYRTLKDSGLECKVRSVIATRHSLPEKPAGSFVKVLPPGELCGFIQYFPVTLTPARAEAVCRRFTNTTPWSRWV